MLALIIILGLSLFVLAYPGRESFSAEAPSPSVAISTDNLQLAGIVRPSVFNCADQIGITAEMSPLFASKYDA
jgi:hypothetical protein